MMRPRTALAVLALSAPLAACAAQSGGKSFVASSTPQQAAQCALAVAGELGYSLADGERGALAYRVRKSIPPRESTSWTTGIITIRAYADADGRTVLRTDAERRVAGPDTGGRRGSPGTGPVIGGVVPEPEPRPDPNRIRGVRRLSPGPVAADAGRIRRVCRTG